jgi:hemolysin D
MKKPAWFGRDDSHEFKPTMAEIEDRPSHPLGRVVFWIVVATMLFFGVWFCVGKVDVVVSARGAVIPEGDVKVLQPLDTGVVSAILCAEGDFVKKGQVLMEIDPSITAPELESKKKTLDFLDLEQARLDRTLSRQDFAPTGGKHDREVVRRQRELYQSTTASLQKQIESKKAEFCRLEEESVAIVTDKAYAASELDISLEREKRLKAVLDIIPRSEYDRVHDDILRHRNAVDQGTSKLEQLLHQKRQISADIASMEESFKVTALREIADKQKQATEIRAEINKTSFRNERQRILAPVDGYISSLLFHTIGGVVTPAQKLITLVPRTAPLVIKAEVLNKDIGFVKQEMPVSIKIDTFDFQKYGILKGSIRSVARHSVDNEKLGPIYEVFVTPAQNCFVIEGTEMTITSGMTLTAEIKVGKRRIIEFFIYPLIKYLDEGITVR